MATRPSIFGNYIQNKRIAARLSLREVARRMAVSHVYVGEVERGVSSPYSRDRWPDLVKAIPGVTLEDLERNAGLTVGVQLNLADAPPEYQTIGLALARRIQARDIEADALQEMLRLLQGDK